LLDELLRRGHDVVALVRKPGAAAAREHVQFDKADVLNADEEQRAVTGCDAVVSAYNAGWNNPDIYADFMQGSRAIVQGVKAAGIKRYLVVGGAGSLYVNGQQLVDSPDFPAFIKPGASAARDMFAELQREVALDWTMLSPAVGFHGGSDAQSRGRTAEYRTGKDEPLMQADGQPGDISVQDLAVALIDALEQGLHVRERFTVAY
jgi:putative NADH-flavin reductase